MNMKQTGVYANMFTQLRKDLAAIEGWKKDWEHLTPKQIRNIELCMRGVLQKLREYFDVFQLPLTNSDLAKGHSRRLANAVLFADVMNILTEYGLVIKLHRKSGTYAFLPKAQFDEFLQQEPAMASTMLNSFEVEKVAPRSSFEMLEKDMNKMSLQEEANSAALAPVSEQPQKELTDAEIAAIFKRTTARMTAAHKLGEKK